MYSYCIYIVCFCKSFLEKKDPIAESSLLYWVILISEAVNVLLEFLRTKEKRILNVDLVHCIYNVFWDAFWFIGRKSCIDICFHNVQKLENKDYLNSFIIFEKSISLYGKIYFSFRISFIFSSIVSAISSIHLPFKYSFSDSA